jgi:hypothetical protein
MIDTARTPLTVVAVHPILTTDGVISANERCDIRRRYMQSRQVAIAIASMVALVGVTAVADGNAVATETRHPSGIVIIKGKLYPGMSAPLTPELERAYTEAVDIARLNPDDMSWPWVDQGRNVVVVPTATGQGQIIAHDLSSHYAFASGVKLEQLSVPRSLRTLDKIMNELIGRQSDGEVVWSSYPEPRRNRIVLDMVAPTDAFLFNLAAEYGPDAVAVHLISADDVGTGGTATREHDTHPFYGCRVSEPGAAVHASDDRLSIRSAA